MSIQQTALLRLTQIIGNPKANPPIPAIIPISRSKLWADIKAGKFPAPVKLGVRCVAWKSEDIRRYIESLEGEV